MSINGYNPIYRYSLHQYPHYEYLYQNISPNNSYHSVVKSSNILPTNTPIPLTEDDTDLDSVSIGQIIDFHTKFVGEEEVEGEICRQIEDLLRSKGIPRGNRRSYSCVADIYDNYSRIKLDITVVNAHKPCGRCPYAYSLTSYLKADTSLTNPNPADFNFCIKMPGGAVTCIDGAEILAIIIEAL